MRVDTHIYNGYKGTAVLRFHDCQADRPAGNTRESAIARMRGALSEVFIDGIKTNIPLHIDIFNDEAFRAGGTNIPLSGKRSWGLAPERLVECCGE